MNVFKKLSSWYFSKNVLPYWVVLLADTVIVFASCCFTFWITNNTDIAFESRAALLYSAFFYSVVSWIGIRIFKTYSGVLRYSSFVDLLKLVYANAVSLAISLGCCWLFSYFHVRPLSAFSYLDLIVAFAMATFVMWIMRVLVKLLFDGVNENAQAQRALIYGAITGGVALAKSVRSQSPRQFEVCGFISHEHRIKDMKLLGITVYSQNDDLAAVIRKERIQAMLVSPLRVNEFRNNQKVQDI
ncbi:MAG: polysaccharide biosynthesis protein, partial [Candidatus Cryptobacteroides sp.]|nr:polysaccharide biosynthesis protein [Candidatus Cryptobacteroides sp.]